jgi:hypothetical protein
MRVVLLTLFLLFNMFFSKAQNIDTTITVSICAGEKFNNVVLNKDSAFVQKLKTTKGADSTVTFKVLVKSPIKSLYSKILCFGEIYQGKKMTKDTTWQTKFKSSISGCDSIAIIEISVMKAADFKISGKNFLCKDFPQTELSVGNFDFYKWSDGSKTQYTQ